ncbi:coatomer subunit zeta-2 isoform X3 [Halichoerus grypus]|uniref:coatomer subunit zeta-2 isoform X3 n=1 Tax=Halichoerus grypus TaxID=9711 RepID=UPI0016596F2F|nr:coatomer subunit zeta-2 isoform X3 [Halichoerus grypus]
MQRPEAWPRLHPGEGAAAAQAGGPAPPARAGEPLQEPSLYTIKAVFILDNDGHRLLAKYYDETFPSLKEQMAFEKNVFNKTSRTDSEIAFFGGMTIIYKSSIDLFLYVVGSSHENELMLMSVLTCLFESLSHVLRKNVEKRWLLENMDGAFLVLDEIVDGGLDCSHPISKLLTGDNQVCVTISVILESDPQQVIQKVNFRADDSSLTEQSVAQVSLPRLILLLRSFLPQCTNHLLL